MACRGDATEIERESAAPPSTNLEHHWHRNKDVSLMNEVVGSTAELTGVRERFISGFVFVDGKTSAWKEEAETDFCRQTSND